MTDEYKNSDSDNVQKMEDLGKPVSRELVEQILNTPSPNIWPGLIKAMTDTTVSNDIKWWQIWK